MTTAQERRRARRLARAAQASGAAATDAGATGPPATTDPVRERSAATKTIEGAVERPRPAPHTVVTNGKYGWIAVKATEAAAPSRARSASVAGPSGRKRWVAVMPRHAAGAGMPTPGVANGQVTPAAGKTVPIPRGEREQDDPSAEPRDDAPPTRALHPRTRAIRITRVKTNGRRRWSVDFLVRQPDMHLPK